MRLKGLIARSIDRDTAAAQTLRTAFHATRKRGTKEAWNALRRVSAVLEREGLNVPILVVPGLDERMVVHWARAQRRLLDVGDPKGDLLYQEAFNAMVKAKARGGGDAEGDDDGDENGAAAEEKDDLFEDVDLTEHQRMVDFAFTEILSRGSVDETFLQHLESSEEGRRVARRSVEESPEEVEVRRRRREAMVLHEGEGQIGREDIFQPRRTP